MNKKLHVAIVLAKGFDGCGVSRFAIEHQKELERTFNTCDIFSYKTKYVRSTLQGCDYRVNWVDKLSDIDFTNYDICILNSYPKEFDEDDFLYYSSLPCIKVAMMHEILRQNVGRISHIWDWISASDIVSSFSSDMDFVTDLFQHFPNKPYFSFSMPMCDADINSLYKTSLDKTKENRLVYFGRWTTMKDPSRLFSYKSIDPSLNLSMIGIERSIGAKFDILDNPLCDFVKLPKNKLIKYSDFEDNCNRDNTKVQVFPPVDRNVAFDILSHSLFGTSFYRLKKNKQHNLGNRMEYTQIELSSLCLPLFDIDWGKNTFDKNSGKSFYELSMSAQPNAIYSDTDYLDDSISEMKYLVNHPMEYNKRRENLYKLVLANYSSSVNIADFYNTVLSF